jgi:hypothetical protein
MTYLPAGQAATKADIADLSARLDRRFEQVDSRFEQVDSRFDRNDSRFDQIDHRFEQMDRRFDQIEHRIERLEDNFQVMVQGFGVVRDDSRDQFKTYSVTMVGGMTALTAIFAGLLTVVT